MHLSWRTASAIAAAAALVTGGAAATAATAATAAPKAPAHFEWFHETTTPIKHLVVIFQENVSFDHYFGTYPNADQHRRAAVHREAGHSVGERAARPRCSTAQPQRRATRSGSSPSQRQRRAHLRPGPQLHR